MRHIRLEGNIDRPVIIGVLYNGAGQPDAQHNQVNQGAGPAIGAAPVWFPGEAGAHAHAAVLSGIKSQAMQSSQAGVSIFTYGKVSNTGKPHQETGIALHSASGKFSSQSQSDETRLTAAGTITVASIEDTVTVAGCDGVLMTTAGAFMRLKGDNLDLHGPGTITFLAGLKDLTGSGSAQFDYPDLPREKLYAAHFKVDDKITGEPHTGRLYRKRHANGKVAFGMTDQDGFTQVVPTSEPEDIKITFDTGEEFHRDSVDEDEVNDWFNEGGEE